MAMALGRRLSEAYLGSYRLSQRARGKAFSILGSRAFAGFGSHSVLQPPIRLSGERHISVGSGVFVGPGSWLQVDGDASGVAIEIGDGTGIVGDCVISAVLRVSLGERVLIARGAYISDHMHAFDDAGTAVMDQGVDRVAPVEIADGAWLGQHVVVGPGVRIGRGAVIGAGAVVLADVPDHAVAVGAPARVIRTFGDVPEPAR